MLTYDSVLLSIVQSALDKGIKVGLYRYVITTLRRDHSNIKVSGANVRVDMSKCLKSIRNGTEFKSGRSIILTR